MSPAIQVMAVQTCFIHTSRTSSTTSGEGTSLVCTELVGGEGGAVV